MQFLAVSDRASPDISLDTTRSVNKNSSHQIMCYRPTLTLLLSFLAVAVIGAGCAWVPQSAQLKVVPTVAPSEQGRGVTIAIEVLDRRMTTMQKDRDLVREFFGHPDVAYVRQALHW